MVSRRLIVQKFLSFFFVYTFLMGCQTKQSATASTAPEISSQPPSQPLSETEPRVEPNIGREETAPSADQPLLPEAIAEQPAESSILGEALQSGNEQSTELIFTVTLTPSSANHQTLLRSRMAFLTRAVRTHEYGRLHIRHLNGAPAIDPIQPVSLFTSPQVNQSRIVFLTRENILRVLNLQGEPIAIPVIENVSKFQLAETYIAYITTQANGHSNLYVVDLDGLPLNGFRAVRNVYSQQLSVSGSNISYIAHYDPRTHSGDLRTVRFTPGNRQTPFRFENLLIKSAVYANWFYVGTERSFFVSAADFLPASQTGTVQIGNQLGIPIEGLNPIEGVFLKTPPLVNSSAFGYVTDVDPITFLGSLHLVTHQLEPYPGFELPFSVFAYSGVQLTSHYLAYTTQLEQEENSPLEPRSFRGTLRILDLSLNCFLFTYTHPLRYLIAEQGFYLDPAL